MTTLAEPPVGTGAPTHEVRNQPPPRVDVDELAVNPALLEALAAYAPGADLAQLHGIGRQLGSAQYQHDAELANRFPPVHHSHDRWGNRIDEIEFHPSYHRIMEYSINNGLHTSAWAHPGPGANAARAAGFYLVSQVEPGHGCPVSMTHAVIPALRRSAELAAVWEPKALSTAYDPQLRDPMTKPGVIFGMGMTEKQGGSDVRANSTTATPLSSGGDGGGTHLLRGHKWFCSAPQSDAFLVLAQAPEGLSCFLVPRVLPGGARNPFFIQRLKDKLGNTSNASSEIELDRTHGWLVGEAGRGVSTIIEMVGRTRLDCVIGTAAGMRQSVAEAAWHARHRVAFGALLVDQPAMTAVLADLQLESEAATWTALHLAAAHDGTGAEQVAFCRLATAVAKYWVCKRGPNHAYEALECLGGNGYTEDFPLARRYREQPVLAIWEGSGNVIALDVLRALAREPESLAAFDAFLTRASGRVSGFDEHVASLRDQLRRVAGDPSAAPAQARRLVEAMGLALQGAILIGHAPEPVAEGFVLARLGADRSLEYGALPGGVDVAALVARA